MAEWSNAAVLKTVDCYRSGGSNPSLSAEENENEKKNENEKNSLSFSYSFSFMFLIKILCDFQELTVYKKAKNFHINCKLILVKTKPDKYVINQLGRASFSIVLNIAEGSAKTSNADRKNYFTTSRGSLFECIAILDILKAENKLSDNEYFFNLKLADEISRILYSMIKNLSQK